ncbi:alpha-glucan family phosphorylase [Candidatus Kryptobacter tengchongensis]|uniref:Starch phosphorylase n=1 Tax=Kryptobacter tengchongensis TaxID=1643429 RepID=A0A916LIN4_KRYT1|nr:alpha-glucan family phosphorylase [Candidatus Kryptobacter tengchongensis]CUS97934.1 starch phosphorylase [Candidatus Kryptobacter tengchongensis]
MTTDQLINELHELAYNLWWTYNPEAQEIFENLSPMIWKISNHNAVQTLKSISKNELKARLSNPEFSSKVKKILEEFKQYLQTKKKLAEKNFPEFINNPIAYFTAEFGLHECLPIYSGGLGVLSGDHAKSASDIGLPFVGISLFYRHGYFDQKISENGWQIEEYNPAQPSLLPIKLVINQNNEPLKIKLNIAHTEVSIQAWEINVGISKIYLLDTNLPENDFHFRDITSKVYGGDSTTRIFQEIVLGIGGVRLLKAMGIEPSVFHLNEGHSAFLTLELLREEINKGKTIKEAEKIVREKCIFTTHTPVPAGHDRFTPDLIEYALGEFIKSLGISLKEFLAYGRIHPDNDQETFCMTVLALKLTRNANAVSELNGIVSRKMWQPLFKSKSEKDVPIGHITNGVHLPTWLSKIAFEFWRKKLGDKWYEEIENPKLWESVLDQNFITDEEIWAIRYELRRNLIEFVREKFLVQHLKMGLDSRININMILSPDALTIGFSRRFATYKRAPLIFYDIDRAKKIFNDKTKPIQIIFSGKAHPRDDAGKEFLQRIIQISKLPEFYGKVIFLENYDMNIARHLVSGCDLWLNNPRRPLEASGTSGQKIILNFGLNFSILDGWWREAYNQMNGWAIGKDESIEDPNIQDKLDAESLYQTLENEIIPAFYNRDENGIPREWIKKIRYSIATITYFFNTNRMVREYAEKYYKHPILVY